MLRNCDKVCIAQKRFIFLIVCFNMKVFGIRSALVVSQDSLFLEWYPKQDGSQFSRFISSADDSLRALQAANALVFMRVQQVYVIRCSSNAAAIPNVSPKTSRLTLTSFTIDCLRTHNFPLHSCIPFPQPIFLSQCFVSHQFSARVRVKYCHIATASSPPVP